MAMNTRRVSDVYERLAQILITAVMIAFLLTGVERPVAGQEKDTQIVAHRGASKKAPENTIPAFKLGWKRGAHAVEGDIRLTKDQRIVFIHDKNTNRTSDQHLDVSNTTLKQLKKLDVGRWKGKSFRGVRIPTLSEVLAIVPENRKILIEVKTGPRIVPALLKTLKKSSLDKDQIRVISFNGKVIKRIERSNPRIVTYWLTGRPDLHSNLKTLKAINADGLDCQAKKKKINNFRNT